MKNYNYDLIVVGSGAAGITAAKLANGLGKKVLMVDKRKMGGECTWYGCVPSKALLQSAKAANVAKNLQKYDLAGKADIKNTNVMKGVQKVVEKIYYSHPPKSFKDLGIEVLENVDVEFIDSNTLKVKNKKLTAAKFVIATGSGPMVPPIEGLDKIKYYTNDNIFSMKKLPKSMIVMGGGAIGVELASAFNRLGVKITLIEMFDKIMFREDEELADILHEKLEDEGLKIITGAKAVKVEGKKNIKLFYEKNKKTLNITGETILVAAGRKPNLEGLNLNGIGLKYTRRGIEVNKYLRTNIKNIYAAGDVVGPYQFSHMAGYQAVVATSNAILPINKKVDYSNVPWVTFTEPELAHSGLTEKEAREKYGKSIRIYKSYYSHLDRANTDRHDEGLVKFICKKNGKILGIHILGERAGDLLHEGHLAKTLNIPLHKLNSVIHAYPTYSELIKGAAQQAYVSKIQNNIIVKIIKLIKGVK